MLTLIFLISLYLPLEYRKTIDSISNKNTLNNFLPIVGVLTGLLVFQSLIKWIYNVYVAYTGESLIIDITSKIYSAILKKKRSFWQEYFPNDVLTRLTQDILSIKSFVFDFTHNVLLQTISTIGILFILFFMSYIVGIVVALEVVLIFAVTYWGSDYLNKRSIKIRQLASSFTEIFQKGILQPSLNFSWDLFGIRLNTYKKTAYKMKKEQVSFVNQVQQINQTVAVLNIIVGTLVIIILLRSDFSTGMISIGTLFAILMYSGQAIQTSSALANNIVSTKISRISVLRVNEIINYDNNDIPFLNPCSEKVTHPFFSKQLSNGILLPSEDKFIYFINADNGAGKSTYSHILTGFDDLGNGIIADGWFLLPSDPVILTGTLLENINQISGLRRGKMEISKTLTDSGMEVLTSLFPNGLDTVLEDKSELISRGQKQAAILMAAVVRNSERIILDEGINSLDINIRTKIKEPLMNWLNNRKAIIIEHDAFLKNAKEQIEVSIINN